MSPSFDHVPISVWWQILIRLPREQDVCNLLCTCRCIGNTFRKDVTTVTQWLLCTGRFYVAAIHPCGKSAVQEFVSYDSPTFFRVVDPALNPLEEAIDGTKDRRRAMHDMAFLFACKAGRSETACLLLEKGADVHFRLHGENALVTAAAHGDEQLVRLLIRYGADVHTDNDDALRFAAEKNKEMIVHILIKNAANVHALDDYALRHSCRLGHVEVVTTLLRYGANRDAAVLPFHRCVSRNTRKHIRALLRTST